MSLEKRKMCLPLKKQKAQSEMVGFAMILIIVAVLFLVFLAISVRSPNDDFVKSYEVESFIQSALGYSTNCTINYKDNVPIRKIIRYCGEEKNCSDLRTACEVLNETMGDILENSWNVGADWPTKGYKMDITIEGAPLVEVFAGNKTGNAKGASQNFDGELDILFIVYS
jgi:hypothetical protein